MKNEHVNQYAERDAMQLDKDGGYYSRHIQAMTREGLHSKGDIAAELAWRDQQIDQLKADLEERSNADSAEPVAWTEKCEITNMQATGLYLRGFPDNSQGRDIALYTAPPVPVVPEGLRLALSNAGIAAPESDEMLAATYEKYIHMLVTWVKDRKPFQPAPVVPEEVMPGGLAYLTALPVFEDNDRDKIIGYRCLISGDTRIVESQEQAYVDGKAVVNACRAAMLQSKYRDLSQPVDPQISEYEKIMLQAGNSPAVRGETMKNGISEIIEILELLDRHELVSEPPGEKTLQKVTEDLREIQKQADKREATLLAFV
ncbi:hypothetical protein ACQLT9_006013, partial [Salmonella enterica subsp. diarizonae]